MGLGIRLMFQCFKIGNGLGDKVDISKLGMGLGIRLMFQCFKIGNGPGDKVDISMGLGIRLILNVLITETSKLKFITIFEHFHLVLSSLT
jgi:hypothetical protein